MRAGAASSEYWLTAGTKALLQREVVDTCLEFADQWGPRPHPPRLIPLESVHRLLLPLIEGPTFPESLRRRFQTYAELLLVFQRALPFESSLGSSHCGTALSKDDLRRALIPPRPGRLVHRARRYAHPPAYGARAGHGGEVPALAGHPHPGTGLMTAAPAPSRRRTPEAVKPAEGSSAPATGCVTSVAEPRRGPCAHRPALPRAPLLRPLRPRHGARADVLETASDGAWVFTEDAALLLDFGGYGVFILGHRHPHVTAAVHRQVDTHPLAGRVFLEPVAALAGRGTGRRRTPPGLDRVHSG